MFARLFACLLAVACVASAAKKNAVATATGENEDLVLTVTLYIDAEGVKEVVGNDLEGHYIVADVKVKPKYGKEVTIDRDDFLLRTDKDGEKTTPFAPSQIAGRAALVIRQTRVGDATGGVNLGQTYPVGYPGGGYPPPVYPGSGPPGPPPVMAPGGVGVGGGGGGDDGAPSATVHNGARDKENPLEKTLKDKELPQKKVSQPASGLLYFGMEKQKMKDLELVYGGRENRISLRFK